MELKVEFDKHHQQCHIKNLIPTATFPIIIFLCHLVRGIVVLQHFCIQLIRHKIFIADTKVEPASVRELKEQKVRECIMLLYIFVVHVGRAAIVMHVISSPVWSLSATCTCMMHNYRIASLHVFVQFSDSKYSYENKLVVMATESLICFANA